MEIGELEAKPYLTNEEQERLRRLRLEQEFQKRVEEVSSKDDEGGDSDTDITDRAAVSSTGLQKYAFIMIMIGYKYTVFIFTKAVYL